MATMVEWRGRVGQEWAKKADALDRLLGPTGNAGLQLLKPFSGKRVLDLGCGAGATALAMARAGAQVTGVDISTDLLARAKERDTAAEVQWIEGDAAQVQFAEPFDALYSRCGAMFFEDQIAAWTHLRGQLKPGAKAVVVCWRDASQNEWASVPLAAARPVLGAEKTQLAVSGAPGPFAWADPDRFVPIFENSGWSGLEYQPVDAAVVTEAGEDPDAVERGVAFAMHVGPLASRLANTPPEVREAVRAVLRADLAGRLVQGQVTLRSAAWVISATA